MPNTILPGAVATETSEDNQRSSTSTISPFHLSITGAANLADISVDGSSFIPSISVTPRQEGQEHNNSQTGSILGEILTTTDSTTPVFSPRADRLDQTQRRQAYASSEEAVNGRDESHTERENRRRKKAESGICGGCCVVA